MIVRILSEGQYELDQEQAASLEDLDKQLLAALETSDESKFHEVLHELIKTVRTAGKPVGPDRFVPSDLTVPSEGASLAELRELMNSEDVGES